MSTNLVRLVCLQFSFSNPNAIPAVVKRLEKETPEERVGRKNNATGSLIIAPTEDCSTVEFVSELGARGYELVDAFYKERIDPKDFRGKRTYHMVRFLFVHKEHVDCSEEFKKKRPTINVGLREMCECAMWRVRVFLNPFFKDGVVIEGQYALSVNLEARKPLFHPDGQPVVVWQKGEDGERIGDAPLPLKPSRRLVVEGVDVQVVPM